jgi:hypothetical protein
MTYLIISDLASNPPINFEATATPERLVPVQIPFPAKQGEGDIQVLLLEMTAITKIMPAIRIKPIIACLCANLCDFCYLSTYGLVRYLEWFA